VLVAKQAACLDVLSGGRFRLGIGIGWNGVEFVGLSKNFHNRGRRSEEQVEVMKAFVVGAAARDFQRPMAYDRRCGDQPLPTGRKIPLWYGGHADVTLRRCAKWGDGWMPLAYPPGEEAKRAIATLHRYAEDAGRDPATIGIDTRVSAGAGTEAERRDQLRLWKSIGVTHLTLANYYESGHLHRISGRSMSDHIAAMKRY
jgi:alkanesulfonate monooxygenase SsuD/methylene tetrahydromethanopterin reductase-like flavin-dependent oxidoreductase (luciferase family)